MLILAHMGDLMEWGERLARGAHRWHPVPCRSWDEARERFFAGLRALDVALEERFGWASWGEPAGRAVEFDGDASA